MANFRPADFARTISFGHNANVNIGGVNVTRFAADYKLHCTQQKRTLTQQYTLVGTRLDETITVITRHDDRNSQAKLAQLGGKTYTVLDCSPDDGADVIRYDYLTLKAVAGHANS